MDLRVLSRQLRALSTPDPLATTGSAVAYDRSLDVLCAGVIPAALSAVGDPRGGSERLLDAGCGTGRLARAAGGRGHRVEAVDVDDRMLDFARIHRNLPGVRYSSGDLLTLDFADDSFDAAIANLVVNHTADPVAAVRELGRVVRPGGIVVATIWPRRVSALNAIWTEVIDRSRAVRLPLPPLTPAQRFDRTTDGLAALMTSAGLEGVEAGEVSFTFEIEPEDLWQTATAGLALVGPVYLAQDAPTRARMRAVYAEITTPATVDGRLKLPMTAILARATAPPAAAPDR